MKIKRGFLIIYPVESHEYLNCVPENEVFSKTEFYSSLKNKISDEEYETYENLREYENLQILCLKKLSELSDICNFQDTIILCEIFENRAK